MSSVIQTKLVCPECGNVFPIMRKAEKQKERFHRKWLFCIECKKVTNHIELKNLENWMKEMEFKGEEAQKDEEKKVYQLIKRRSE